jgi:hypothetical protein
VAGPLLGRALDDQARRRGRIDFLDQFKFAALEQAVLLLDVAFLEAEIGRGGRDLGVVSTPTCSPRAIRPLTSSSSRRSAPDIRSRSPFSPRGSHARTSLRGPPTKNEARTFLWRRRARRRRPASKAPEDARPSRRPGCGGSAAASDGFAAAARECES